MNKLECSVKDLKQKYEDSENSKKQLQVKSQEEIDELKKACERLERDLKSVLKKYKEDEIPDLIEDAQIQRTVQAVEKTAIKRDVSQSVDQGIDTLTENLSQVQAFFTFEAFL